MTEPTIYVNGKRAKIRAECANCGLVSEQDNPPDDWEYVELDPHEGTWGWLCSKCANE